MSLTADLVAAFTADLEPDELAAKLDAIGIPADATIAVPGRHGLRRLDRRRAVEEAVDFAERLDDLRSGALDDEPARWRHAEEDRLISELNTYATAFVRAIR